MKRDIWLVLILGCILILLLEAPAALSSVADDFAGPYARWEPPSASSTPGVPIAGRDRPAPTPVLMTD